MIISGFVGDNMNCFPSLQRLADLSGVTIRTVSRSVKSLQEKGYITIEKRQSDTGVNVSNLYTLNLEAINSGIDTPVKEKSKVVAFDKKRGFVKR